MRLRLVAALVFLVAVAFAPFASAAPNPYGDPNLVPMFDGTTLNGWTPSAAGGWNVADNAIHGTGTAGRGWIYYNKQQAGTFRWIFDVRQVTGNHAPTVLIWGTVAPIRDALSAIQFQPPNGGHWDYRPGHNNGGGKEFTQLKHPKWNVKQWSQCEIVATQSTGVARMACCPLTSGATTLQGDRGAGTSRTRRPARSVPWRSRCTTAASRTSTRACTWSRRWSRSRASSSLRNTIASVTTETNPLSRGPGEGIAWTDARRRGEPPGWSGSRTPDQPGDGVERHPDVHGGCRRSGVRSVDGYTGAGWVEHG